MLSHKSLAGMYRAQARRVRKTAMAARVRPSQESENVARIADRRLRDLHDELCKKLGLPWYP